MHCLLGIGDFANVEFYVADFADNRVDPSFCRHDHLVSNTTANLTVVGKVISLGKSQSIHAEQFRLEWVGALSDRVQMPISSGPVAHAFLFSLDNKSDRRALHSPS